MSPRRIRLSPARAHARVVEAVWNAFVSVARVIGVQSPPGAGKSTLVRTMARRWADERRSPLAVVTQTNPQADDLCADLAADFTGTGHTVGRLHGQDYVADPRLVAAGVQCSTNIMRLATCDVVIAPAKKWAYVTGHWPAAIIDEVYQMRSDHLIAIADLFDKLLVVGDPGQLKPFTIGDEKLLRGRLLSPLETAADTLRLTHPDSEWLTLPVSWRLPREAATVISDAFYTTPFRAGVADGVRQLHLTPRAASETRNRALAKAAGSRWAFVELPEAHLPRTDPEAVEVITDLVDACVATELAISDEHGGPRPLQLTDLAVAVAHRDQRGHVTTAVDRALAAHGIPAGSVTVETANRLQGRQFDLVIAWHPLSGRRDASRFHLEAGRLCVMLSRHRQACIVVSRAGVREQLESHPGIDAVWIGEAAPAVDGWEANLTLLDELERHRVAA